MTRRADGLRRGAATLMLLAVAGCSPTHRDAPAPPAAPPRLAASVTQFRFDEGTRHLKAGVTNRSRQDIRVSQATIDWDALDFETVAVPDDVVHPGQTAAFTIAYGAPHCARTPSTPPVLVAVVDGHRRRLALKVEDPGLLRRLQEKACAAQRLDRAVGVHLRLADSTIHLAGEEYLPGQVVVRHRPGSTARVRVVDLGGSVLIDLVPRAGRAALPGVLSAHRRSLTFPVLLGSAHRCDAHARGQSSQTFLISGYVRLGRDPEQRVVFPLDTGERDQLNGLLDRDCRR